jgi:hypothetical protein
MADIISPNEVLKDFTERLEKAGISYVLTGSMAMMYYATPRYTADIDIVAEIHPSDVRKLLVDLSPNYYFSENRMRDAIDRKAMFNLIHEESSFKVDCIIKKDSKFQNAAFENKERVNYQGFEIWITTIEDLIVSKLLWAKDSHSEFQKRDIINLLQKEPDLEYIKSWAQTLDVEDLFNECLAERL